MRRPFALAVLVAVATACGDATPEPATAPVGPAPAAPAALTASMDGRAPVASGAPVEALAVGFNEAGFDLLRTQPAAANVVLSPASVGHALLLARAAADPATGAAIDGALALPPGIAAHDAWNAVDQAIAAAQGADVAVQIADRIWPRADRRPDQAWVDLLSSHHGVDTQTLDLAGQPEQSRGTINDWVADRTKGLIPELLPAGFIRPDTVLVLTDALYFEARWATPFGKYPAVDGTFTRADGSEVPVELMSELELQDVRGRGPGYVGAELPYAGGAFSMLLIVPDEGRFAEIRGRLGQELLDEVDATFTTGPYELLLPRWDDHTDLDLEPWLTSIGAAPGEYPAIGEGVFLDAGAHAADIAVDEVGTVAAAATGLGFAESGPPEPELTVAADRPFLYLIRHRASGLVLFAGQVNDPTA